MNTKEKYILIVDDVEMNRCMLELMFNEQYSILQAENGQQAIEILDKYHDSIALVFLDIMMPIKNGFDVLDHMVGKNYLDLTPVILITVDAGEDSMERAYNYGVSDYIKKPFTPRTIIRRSKNIIDLYESKRALKAKVAEQGVTLNEMSENIRRTNENMIDALAAVVEFRNLESGEHIRRIKYLTRLLLKYVVRYHPEAGVTEADIDPIVRASALHDIGKIGIADSILCKPGRLTPEEFEEMKKHSSIGCSILQKFDLAGDAKFVKYCYDICRYHHERWDGKGYPDGLKGDAIPVSAQIVAIADVYDALISARVYKSAYTHKKAVEMIYNGECGAFSPLALDCFRLAESDLLEIMDVIGNVGLDVYDEKQES